MAIATLGRTGFEDSTIPVPGKSEFGMDTLTRKMVGVVSGLEAYVASLNQGATYVFNGVVFYLQSWMSDDATPIASVTLSYKGLKTDGTPIPDIQTDIASAVGRITKSYLHANGGLGITLRNRVLWRYGITNPVSGVVEDEIVATRPVYTVSATAEFLYHAVESRYRYIRTGRPSAPEYDAVESSYVPEVEEARITTSDGATYAKSDMSSLDLLPEPHTRVVSWSNKNVIGSPYFECEEVVRLELVDPDDIS